jgi:hypothetical protein
MFYCLFGVPENFTGFLGEGARVPDGGAGATCSLT